VLSVLSPALAEQKPTQKPHPVGTLFKILGGQPRNAKKVGLAFASVNGVEIYWPEEWTSQENLPSGWILRLTRPDVDHRTDIHIEDSEAFNFEQVFTYNTDTLKSKELIDTITKPLKTKIGDYKAVPALDTTIVYGDHNERFRRIVYFGYPPRVHALTLECRAKEYETLKPDFEHILSTISIHDGVH
jgi:hypothetical protein